VQEIFLDDFSLVSECQVEIELGIVAYYALKDRSYPDGHRSLEMFLVYS